LDDPGEPRAASLETALSLRLKLALVAGFAPELASCARCGDAEHLAGFSGAAGGVVCVGCEAGAFPLSEEAHRFMVDGLAKPLSEAPSAEPKALRQVERAVGETLEHHAHVQLRAAA
ncbi:MAG TPA: DNA repair protein RecO C-terminal domain-containing protein, partial [Solirubrobacterales bacterium]|nr:DNA repair protein RecO C-terminal domain-containing protein [Solirubrobacterales bacterium]